MNFLKMFEISRLFAKNPLAKRAARGFFSGHFYFFIGLKVLGSNALHSRTAKAAVMMALGIM